jgi:hypothetical protein
MARIRLTSQWQGGNPAVEIHRNMISGKAETPLLKSIAI